MTCYTVYRLNRKEKAMSLVMAASALAVVGILFYDTLLLIVLTPLLYIPVSKLYASYMAEKRINVIRLEFIDLLDSFSASFAGGRHLREALIEAERELGAIYRDDDYIMVEIRGMLKKMNDGETADKVLSDFAVRTGMEDAEMFSQVFSTCRETGGDIVRASASASEMLGEKIKIENDMRALLAQKKSEGFIIGIMPAVIILFLRIVAPDYIAVLYGNPGGILLMTLALAAAGFAYYLIRKISDFEV